MKTLIVDNRINQVGPSSVVQAIKLFSDYKVVSFEDIKPNFRIDNDVNAMVLTGSEARIVSKEDVAKFSEVIKLIKRINLPTLGICFGHQLMALAHGARVASCEKPVMNRFEMVRILEADKLFLGYRIGEKIPLAENHYDYVRRKGLDESGLQLLADSTSCEVEAIKHKNKPFYGVQFHPETTKIKGIEHKDGIKVIKNFYRHVVATCK